MSRPTSLRATIVAQALRNAAGAEAVKVLAAALAIDRVAAAAALLAKAESAGTKRVFRAVMVKTDPRPSRRRGER